MSVDVERASKIRIPLAEIDVGRRRGVNHHVGSNLLESAFHLARLLEVERMPDQSLPAGEWRFPGERMQVQSGGAWWMTLPATNPPPPVIAHVRIRLTVWSASNFLGAEKIG